LLKADCNIKLFDPEAMDNLKMIFNTDTISYCKNSYNASEKSNTIILVTEWNTFKELNLERLKNMMITPFITDLRAIYPRQTSEKNNFDYFTVGPN
jgi:UDPglucose 6-dehydrogenase